MYIVLLHREKRTCWWSSCTTYFQRKPFALFGNLPRYFGYVRNACNCPILEKIANWRVPFFGKELFVENKPNYGQLLQFEPQYCIYCWFWNALWLFVRKLQVNAIGNVPHPSMIMASYPIIIRNVLSPNWYLLPSAFNESSNLEVIWDISISANGYCCNKLSSN